LESFDHTKKHIVVIDPDNWCDFRMPADFWRCAPSYGITCVYIEHGYCDVPLMVRTSCDILCTHMADGAPPALRLEHPDFSFSMFRNGWRIWRLASSNPS
jgi:hypothetical protein